MDRFQELSAFIAVVEAGGFSAAARRMGGSQSMASKSVSALEQRLGVKLLNRSTRSVALTPAGRRYYERSKPILEEMQQADEELAGSVHEIAGPVRIAAPSTFGRLHVLPLLPRLLALYPKIQLDVRLSDRTEDLVAEGVDLAIRVSPVYHADSVVRKVASTSLVCAGSRAYFERHGTPRHPQELTQHNCLVYDGAADWVFSGPAGPITVRVGGNLASNTAETILAGVRAGLGIGMFHGASLTDSPEDADVVTVLDEFISESRALALVWPSRRFISATVRQVTDFFAEELARRV